MALTNILSTLEACGISLRVEDGQISFAETMRVITPKNLRALQEPKEAML